MREDKRACRFNADSPYVDLAAEVFRLLSDPTRIRIILALRDCGELSVNHLAELIGKSPTTTSQHLAKLRWGRIVGVRPDGTRMFYELIDDHARELVAQAVFQAEHALDLEPAHGSAGPDAPGRKHDDPSSRAGERDDTVPGGFGAPGRA
ncbi:metalloregulator ArsR/SmtB family transcription factor [Gordonia sp. PP30]|uniref:ArsR/SmtB family transcription factor n=1 Tax=unclassified Gordonia (in: high G+C Gram-positive bacteria) TaxID=2657482 RepID=UPI001FFFAB2B|nr:MULTISPECIES: metalloregulator ArsR/SmtB family transcription factor [unclassified Gordonia (in: high G+C Gram-positive bacteria)]UQE76832.1 metalloregulator ArsR/SmtB family transcription factor [Gordonia sp. PP30]